MKLYIIAGEASGDLLGSSVMRALRSKMAKKEAVVQKQELEIVGIGGALMRECGLKSLFEIWELAVGGITEAIPHIFKIRQLIKKTAQDIINKAPDIVLTIDSPEFCFRVVKLVRQSRRDIRLIHLVAPSVWAWRPWRARQVAKIYDHLLTLFEFEPPYFNKYGLKTTFVGHPIVESCCEIHGVKDDVLLLMPGSRRQEVKQLLVKFIRAASQIGIKIGIKRVVVPTLPHIESYVRRYIESIPSEIKIETITNNADKEKLYKTAKLAIVAGGTATLQLTLFGCPMIVCYRLSWLSYAIIRPMVRVRYISLVNIIANQSIVPELVQRDCSVDNIIKTAADLDYQQQLRDFDEFSQRLRPGPIELPSEKIASIILEEQLTTNRL
ncbi:MAG: lipid-A-disaccharide synthase [Holosporales bacterium]|jgi:lipid-A-disaccharide synthase|nr:lipid-A-disaccharide synthase [Holosporales bacterium]